MNVKVIVGTNICMFMSLLVVRGCSLSSSTRNQCSVGRGKCGRGAVDLASLSGDGRCGRHTLDLRRFHVLWDGCVAGQSHDALGDALLREDDMGRLGLGVDAARPVGAVVRHRRNSAPNGELLVAPPCSQTSFTSPSSRARMLELVSVCSHLNDGLPLAFGTIGYKGCNTCEPEHL